MQTYELCCVCLCACTRPGESSWRDSSRKCKSPQLDVSGKPRHTTVTLPSSVLRSKSCSAPVQNHFCFLFFCQKCAGRVFVLGSSQVLNLLLVNSITTYGLNVY